MEKYRAEHNPQKLLAALEAEKRRIEQEIQQLKKQIQ